MWPNARVSVMGGEQLSQVMSTVSSNAKRNSSLQCEIEHQSTPEYASARLWDDGIIKPQDTRNALMLALEVVKEGREKSKNLNSSSGKHPAWDGNGHSSGVYRM